MKIKSISTKTFSLFLTFILLIIGLSWVLQTYFLEEYYVHKKLETMKNYGNELEDNLYTMNKEELESYMLDISEKIGGRVMILDQGGDILLYSGQGGKNKGFMGTREILPKLKEEGVISYRMTGHSGMGMNGSMEWLVYGILVPLDEELAIIIQSPLQSIKDTVVITQQFYVYIFGAAILFSILLGFVFSIMVTKPLVRLNNLVKEMGSLNFDVRYKEDRQDEIGQLGRTFNFLITKLEKTIGDLKIELQKEKNLDKMRKQFIARVSHELQTPISIIQGYAEGLKDGVVTEKDEVDFYCDVINDETHKLSRIVRDLLDLSQLESGTFKVEKMPFHFTQLVEEMVGKYRLILKEKKIELELIGGEEEIWVLGDEHRIEQIMINFLQNAFNHTEIEGKITIILNKKEEVLRVGIQNTGQKIPEDEMDFIWNSFYKGKNKEEKKGTGLGLAIGKSILQLHESEFGVRNLEDGVEFFFTLKTE